MKCKRWNLWKNTNPPWSTWIHPWSSCSETSQIETWHREGLMSKLHRDWMWHCTISLIPSMNKTPGYFILYINQVLKPKTVFSITYTQTSKKYQVKKEHDIKVSAWLSQRSLKIRTSKQLQMILYLESFCSRYSKDWLWNISVYLHYQLRAWNKQCLTGVHRHSCICTWIFKVIRPL